MSNASKFDKTKLKIFGIIIATIASAGSYVAADNYSVKVEEAKEDAQYRLELYRHVPHLAKNMYEKYSEDAQNYRKVQYGLATLSGALAIFVLGLGFSLTLKPSVRDESEG